MSAAQRSTDHRLRDYPALASLRITTQDLQALSQQGFVSSERRGNRTYYKLRFRRDGQQAVRYVGSAARAAAVEDELRRLQLDSTVMRELRARVKTARRILRASRRQLEPLLQANGFAFHGLAIRRPRQRPAGDASGETLHTTTPSDTTIPSFLIDTDPHRHKTKGWNTP